MQVTNFYLYKNAAGGIALDIRDTLDSKNQETEEMFGEIKSLRLEQLSIRGNYWPSAQLFEVFKKMGSVKRVIVSTEKFLTNDFNNISSIEEFEIYTSLNSLPDMNGMSNLKSLSIERCKVFDRDKIPDELKEINIGRWNNEDVSLLLSFPKLSSVIIRGGKLKGLDGIEEMHSLTSLDVCLNPGLCKIEFLPRSLKSISLENAKKLVSYSFLDQNELEFIKLVNCPPIPSLSVLRGCKAIFLGPGVTILDADVKCLLDFPNLQFVWFKEDKSVKYNATLSELRNSAGPRWHETWP